MQTKSSLSFKSIATNKIFWLIISIFIIELFTDLYIELIQDPSSWFVKKNYFNLTICLSATLLHALKLIKKNIVLLTVIYCVVISIVTSLGFRLEQPNFNFEIYFLKVEIIFLVLIFASGLFVKPIHKFIVGSINILFIGFCYFYTDGFPLPKFVFYGVLVSTTAYVTFSIFKTITVLNTSLNKQKKHIKDQNQKLVQANIFKDDIIKIIGHDLRTPMLQVSSLIELLEDMHTEEERQQCLDYIKQASESSHHLLEELIVWTKGSSPKAHRSISKEIDLNALVDKTFTFFQHSSKEKQLVLINKINHEITLQFQQQSLETILRNFISNAIKFSAPGKQIIASNKIIDKYFIISVSNEGTKVDSATDTALQTNQKLKSNLGTNNEEGTGNGLQICKQLAKLHDAKLELTPTTNGSVAKLYIPI